MELEILHGIQTLHREGLNEAMIFLSALGNGGIFWIVVSVILVAVPQKDKSGPARKCGFTMMAAMLFSYVVGNLFLKNVIARPRPFLADDSVKLLIDFPSEYSFPSGHTLNSFTAAVTIFLYHKRAGIAALILAALIAFSRLYLFVHYPTDIVGGILLGIGDACLIYWLIHKWEQKRAERK